METVEEVVAGLDVALKATHFFPLSTGLVVFPFPIGFFP